MLVLVMPVDLPRPKAALGRNPRRFCRAGIPYERDRARTSSGAGVFGSFGGRQGWLVEDFHGRDERMKPLGARLGSAVVPFLSVDGGVVGLPARQ
jgi:hypothetical protein